MIKVVSQTYFADVQENRNLNRFIRKNLGSNTVFNDYVKEKFNATYERPADWSSPSLGSFVFENEQDAIVFMLKWP
jgi:hypothetical protein